MFRFGIQNYHLFICIVLVIVPGFSGDTNEPAVISGKQFLSIKTVDLEI